MVAYRFDPDYTIAGRHYSHSLIDWPSIVAGAIVAISVGFFLNILGLAIGATAFNPFEINRKEDALTLGGGLYALFAQLVALQAGGYVASRSSKYPDHFGGALTGFMVWALAVFVAVVLAVWTASAVSSGDAIPAGVADVAGEISDAVEGQGVNAGELETSGDAANAIAMLSWTTFGALALGLAGAIAGGWLGAAHPKWEGRPRLDEAPAYKSAPRV